ncbi:MAG: hypothetical protein K0S75_1138 [Clostridia bacterium]|jgi:uncharacterized protein YebE (UPF0316 family)|nr:hypothetical protein [Clostridia bacterium]
MTQQVIFAIIGLFLITALTNILATLRTILTSRNIMNPVYILSFADAVIFAATISKVSSADGLHYTISYALGRTLGVYIGNKLEEKLALGILEVDIFLSDKDKMIEVAEELRNGGYTVNNFLARGNNGDRRYKVEVVVKRKEFKILQGILNDCGVTEPTLKVKSLNSITGKITSTRSKTA